MHPARHYILHLLALDARVRELTNDKIRTSLRGLDLYANIATDEVLSSLRSSYPFPATFEPLSNKHKESIEMRKTYGIYDLFAKKKECMAAQALLLGMSRGREIVEQLLLSRLSFPKIASTVSKHTPTPISAEVIAYFKHYYFDVDAISRTLWIKALEDRPWGVYQSALAGEAEVVLWRLGEKTTIDHAAALEEIYTEAYMGTREIRSTAMTPRKAIMLQRLAETMIGTRKAMLEDVDPTAEIVCLLQQFKQSRSAAVPRAYAELPASAYNDPLLLASPPDPALHPDPAMHEEKARPAEIDHETIKKKTPL